MKMANFILPLCMVAAPALAQDADVPGKGNPNGMSDRDYQIQREKILKRMKAASPQQSQQTAEQNGSVKRAPAHDSSYGQGYDSRKNTRDTSESKPAIENSRPERPERPQIERPGRP